MLPRSSGDCLLENSDRDRRSNSGRHFRHLHPNCSKSCRTLNYIRKCCLKWGEVGGSQKRRLNLWSASSRERLAQVRNALGAGLRSRATLSAALKAETVGKA